MKNFILLFGAMLVSMDLLAQDPVVFDDDYGTGVSFVAFGGSINDISVVTTEFNTGTSSLQVVVPASDYTGGALVVDPGRDVSSYDQLTFWAKASQAATLNVAGVGNDNVTTVNQTEVTNLGLTTEWQQFTITPTDPSVLTSQTGLFHFAEGADEGVYTIWFDDITYGNAGGGSDPDPVVFDDDYGTGVSFVAFGGSINDISVVTTEFNTGTSSLQVVVPASDYTGGALVVDPGRDVSSYDQLTFWAKASQAATLNVAGVGNDNVTTVNQTEVTNLGLTTEWQQFTITPTDPSVLTSQTGLFHFAEGADEGVYTIWFDDITYSNAGGGGGTTPNGPELVVNGGFETAVGAEWEFLDQGGTISITDTEKRDGINSALIVADVAGNGGAASFPVMNQNPFGENNVQPGDMVRVTFDMKAVSGTAAPVYKAALFSNFTPSGAFRHEITFPAITGEWQTITADFTTDGALDPASGLGIQFQADCGANPDCSAQVYIDNVSAFVLGDIDTERPVITLNGDNPFELETGTPFVDPGFSASDNIDGDITGSVVVSGDVVDENVEGSYEIRYNVNDAEGNAAIEVSRIVNVGAGGVDVGPSLIANGGFETGDLTSWVDIINGGTIVVNDVDANGGTFSAQVVADVAGNGGAASFPVLESEPFAQNEVDPSDVVVVSFDIKGSIAGSGGVPKAALFSNFATGSGAFRHEIILPTLTGAWQSVSVEITTNDGLDVNNGLTLQFQADCGGNPDCIIDMRIDNVSVSLVGGGGDTTPPVITLLGDATVNVALNDSYTDAGATASDDTDGNITADIVVGGDVVDTSVDDTYVITYNVMDAAGNAAVEVTRTVVVGTGGVKLPLDFELSSGDYTFTTFGDAVFAVAADPDDAGNNALQMTRPAGTMWWSGGTVALDVPVDATTGTFTMDVYSSIALGYVELKLEQTPGIETIMSATHGGTGWETLTFDTSTGAINGVPSAAVVVVVTPRITNDGAVATNPTVDEIYFFDNLQIEGIDTTPPVITLLGDATVNVALNDSYTDAGATAADDTDGDITGDIVVGGDVVDTSVEDTYVITYNVMDAAGNAAAEVTRTVIVASTGLMSQTITFDAISAKTLGEDPFTLTATTTSDLDVTFSSTSDKIEVTSVGEVTLLAAGSVTIDANQAGNATFAAAETVSQSFCINPATPIITVSDNDTDVVTLTSDSDTGNQWFLNGEAIDGSTGSAIEVESIGIYTVQVTVEGCISAMSDEIALIVTGNELGTKLDVTVYPNPASNYLEVKGSGIDTNTVQLYDLSGRSRNILFFSEEQSLKADISQLPDGVYVLIIRGDEINHRMRIIKK